MALSMLSGDEQCIIFCQLCNTLDPGVAVAFGSISSELRALTPALLQQLRTDYEVATALCVKMGMRDCKEMREAKTADWNRNHTGLSTADLATLGTLGVVLPALQILCIGIGENSPGAASPDGVQQLVEGLSAGVLPGVTTLYLLNMLVGDAGASALAAALSRGALPRLTRLWLHNAAIGDAGMVALAPALRRRPALEKLELEGNPFGDEGLAALVAPPPPAGALPPPTGGLKKLRALDLSRTQVSDAGCAALAAALDSGTLPALEPAEYINLDGIPASAAAKAAVHEACHKLTDIRGAGGLSAYNLSRIVTLANTIYGSESGSESDEDGEEEIEDEEGEDGGEGN